MDEPDEHGLIHYRGDVLGGHELVLAGYLEKGASWGGVKIKSASVVLDNSWGPDWGVGGSCRMTVADLGDALAARGDVIFPNV